MLLGRAHPSSLVSLVSLVHLAAEAVLLALVIGALSCGAGDAGVPGGGDGGGDGAVESLTPYVLEWGPITAAPGEEGVKCVVLRMGNLNPAKIHQIHNVLGNVSHHYIVYKTPETEERPEPYDCESLQNLIDPANGLPLMITQKYEETLTLPAGVAFEFEADQMLRLELHYLNASDQPLEVKVTSTFTPMPSAEMEYAADFLFVGNPDIEILPGQSATLETYIPALPDFHGASFFGFTGHQHQWGTNVQVAVAESEQGPNIPVYELPNFNWDEPETVYHDPPVVMPAGGGFRFTCEWQNQGTTTAHFGENVDDEMCFFWTYYYPARYAKTCFHTDQVGSIDVCCPGHPYCDLIGNYF
jgi:hypothetical protein